eukprot:749158-Prorocentrum_lima.AAC.1
MLSWMLQARVPDAASSGQAALDVASVGFHSHETCAYVSYEASVSSVHSNETCASAGAVKEVRGPRASA